MAVELRNGEVFKEEWSIQGIKLVSTHQNEYGEHRDTIQVDHGKVVEEPFLGGFYKIPRKSHQYIGQATARSNPGDPDCDPMPGKVIGCRGVDDFPLDQSSWWFLLLDKDGDFAELDYEATATAIEGGITYKTHFEKIAERLPSTPMDPTVKWKAEDYTKQLLATFNKTDPDEYVLVLNRAEISEGAVNVQDNIATIATCFNHYRSRPTFDGESIAVVNTFASSVKKGATGDVSHLTSSFVSMAFTDQKHYQKTTDRHDGRYSHFKHPDGTDEWNRNLETGKKARFNVCFVFDFSCANKTVLSPPRKLVKHMTTGGSKEQVESDQAGDQELAVAVSSMAYVATWESCCYLKLKGNKFYEVVCGRFANARNSKKLTSVKISVLAEFYEYLFSTGVQKGYHTPMPVISYPTRRLTVPLDIVRRREAEYKVVFAARLAETYEFLYICLCIVLRPFFVLIDAVLR